ALQTVTQEWSPEQHRQGKKSKSLGISVQFRSLEWEEGQSPKDLLTLLKELCTKWLQPQKHSIDQIIYFILLEQLLQVFDIKLRTWVEEHRPKHSKEAE
uniref:SCAN box domain-containing protein n=1 Tax=Erpetoichthys calabaricus TaxID=27687 RepID=A0A8C4RX51_ERPCA